MRRPFLILMAIGLSLAAHAQDSISRVLQIKIPTGIYEISPYDSNIIRIRFSPYGYTRTEALSDAVQDMRVNKASVRYVLRGDTVILYYRQDSVPVFPKRSSGYRGFGTVLRNGEKIFGGGERAIPLDRRGYRLELYNQPAYGYAEGAVNLNYSVPFITSSAGYGLFFDNPSKGYVDIGKKDPPVLEYGAFSGELNVYVLFGNYAEVLQSYHRLTGTQPLPPRWAFGHLMSRFGYTSEAQVKDILEKTRQQFIPVDAVIFDLFWFGDSIKGTLGNLDWVNRTAWPFPGKMIQDLKRDGIQTILVTEPFIVTSSKNYKAASKYFATDSTRKPYVLKDFYFGNAGLIDIFRRDARQWFQRFYQKQIKDGVAGWWLDLGEPEKHPEDLYHNLRGMGHKRLFSAHEVHNLYGHNWTKMLYDLYKAQYPERRFFNLNRSGYAGSQRYSIFPWTGDVSRSWSGLRSQLPVLLGMTMSGVPYVHSDAGGFAGGEGDNELYVRWLQFAAFTPVFRPHGTALNEKDPSAYSFPSEIALIDSAWRDYAKWAAHFRYLMLPYNYSLGYAQAKWGKPLMAPMYYYFPADSNALKAEDQYMWGEALLVAPVLQKGAGTRTTYLPKGNWYSFFDTAVRAGNNYITENVTRDKIPVYVKEGSFIPMWTPQKHLISNTREYDTINHLTIRYFPSADSSTYQLYEDDGNSNNALRQGRYAVTTFSGITSGNKATIVISTEGVQRFVQNRSFIIQFPKKIRYPLKASLNGKALDETSLIKTAYGYNSGYTYEGIMLTYNGTRTVLEVELE